MAVVIESMPKELVSFFIYRKKLYQFLHFLFQEPVYESAFLELKESSNLKELVQIHDGGKILQKFFNHLSPKNIQKIQGEYQQLFLGPGPLGAPPWESFYHGKNQHLKEWNCEVGRLYQRYGLTFLRESNEPDDHLLIELEFLIFLVNASLYEQQSESIYLLITEQITFIEDHLVKWIPSFCERVIDYSNSRLYVGAAMLLSDFLEYDLASLYEVKESLRKMTI